MDLKQSKLGYAVGDKQSDSDQSHAIVDAIKSRQKRMTEEWQKSDQDSGMPASASGAGSDGGRGQ